MIKGKMNHEAWVHRSRREGSDNETILSTSNTDYVSENTSIARFALNISQSSNFYPLSTLYAHTSYQKTTTKTPNQVDHRLRARLIIHHQSTHAPTKIETSHTMGIVLRLRFPQHSKHHRTPHITNTISHTNHHQANTAVYSNTTKSPSLLHRPHTTPSSKHNIHSKAQPTGPTQISSTSHSIQIRTHLDPPSRHQMQEHQPQF